MFYTKLSRTSQLTASRLDIYPSSHTDRARDPRLLQRFFELDRTLMVGCLTRISNSGVEGYGVDMTHQALKARREFLCDFWRVIHAAN